MIRVVAVIAVLTACSDDRPDDGVALPACQDCGPGAVLSGRFVALELGPEPVVANRHGTVARVLLSQLSWLDDAFTSDSWRSFDEDIMSVAIDDSGGTAISVGSYYEYMQEDAAVISFGPDHVERWRDELGTILGASVAASPEIVAVSTDAKQINGTVIASSSYGSTLVGLRASDGSVAWHKQIQGGMAFAPDGTLIVAGTFADTLDLGGTTTPLTSTSIDGFVAALDPMTGEGRWVVRLDGMGSTRCEVGAVAVGPAGEVAVAWTTDFTATAVSLILLDKTGVVRWTQPTSRVGPIVTDGEHVVTSGGIYTSSAGSFAQYSATGMDWQRPVTGTGVDLTRVLAFAEGRLIGSIHSSPQELGGPPASTTIGDVTYRGDGLAIVALAH